MNGASDITVSRRTRFFLMAGGNDRTQLSVNEEWPEKNDDDAKISSQ